MFDALPTAGGIITGMGTNTGPWITAFLPLIYLFGGIGIAFAVIRWLTNIGKIKKD